MKFFDRKFWQPAKESSPQITDGIVNVATQLEELEADRDRLIGVRQELKEARNSYQEIEAIANEAELNHALDEAVYPESVLQQKADAKAVVEKLERQESALAARIIKKFTQMEALDQNLGCNIRDWKVKKIENLHAQYEAFKERAESELMPIIAAGVALGDNLLDSVRRTMNLPTLGGKNGLLRIGIGWKHNAPMMETARSYTDVIAAVEGARQSIRDAVKSIRAEIAVNGSQA
jgi:hypothetical protein